MPLREVIVGTVGSLLVLGVGGLTNWAWEISTKVNLIEDRQAERTIYVTARIEALEAQTGVVQSLPSDIKYLQYQVNNLRKDLREILKWTRERNFSEVPPEVPPKGKVTVDDKGSIPSPDHHRGG